MILTGKTKVLGLKAGPVSVSTDSTWTKRLYEFLCILPILPHSCFSVWNSADAQYVI